MPLILRRSAALLLAATMAVACSDSSDPEASPSPTGPSSTPTGGSPSQPSCSVSIPDLPSTVPVRGGSYVLSLLAPDCAWNASVQADGWATISPTSGRGSSTPTLRVLENVQPNSRTLVLTVNGQSFRTVQEGVTCTYMVGSTGLEIGQEAARVPINVTAPAGCGWTATSSESWVVVKTPSGSGSGTVNLEIPRNTGDARHAFVTVANYRIAITQARAE